MAQVLSGISLKQSIQATMSGDGTNIQNNIRIGRTKNLTVSASDADIIYSFKITSTGATDEAVLLLTTGACTASTGSPTIQDRSGHTYAATDAVGDSLVAASVIVGLYYETDSDTTGDITVTSSSVGGSDTSLGTVKLGSGGAMTRSMLLIPRVSSTDAASSPAQGAKKLVFTFEATGDDITVVVLANSTS